MPTAAAKQKQKPTAASHPPYFQMIKEAILALRDRTGSSPQAIAKHVEEKHEGQLPANFRKILSIQLRSFAAKGKLVKVKASFKLSEEAKMEKSDSEKQKPKEASAVRKTKSLGAVKSPKKAVIKTKRKAVSPAKPKQPKSIKSPAAKKVKKKKGNA
ncbi:Histone H1 [Ananas comosus]|uniref:Histone H1 n=1 Tax=Ananas comosus TaxID=4615 RepID=A0A199UZ40_ANACO|nr:Histone H1 [Ananas comosus]